MSCPKKILCHKRRNLWLFKKVALRSVVNPSLYLLLHLGSWGWFWSTLFKERKAPLSKPVYVAQQRQWLNHVVEKKHQKMSGADSCEEKWNLYGTNPKLRGKKVKLISNQFRKVVTYLYHTEYWWKHVHYSKEKIIPTLIMFSFGKLIWIVL